MKIMRFLWAIVFALCVGAAIQKKDGIVYRATILLEKLDLDWCIKKYIRKEEVVDATHVKTTLFNGMPILVHSQDRCVCRSIRLFGFYEKAETKLVLSLIKEGDIIVEAGANYGYYTLLMAEKVGSKGRIYSYEANPDVYAYLYKTLEMNNLTERVVAKNNALADRTYHSFMVYGEDNVGAGYILSEEQVKKSQEGEYSIRRPITVTSLDKELPNIQADMLRMDVEGAEYLILKGARNLLHASPHLKIIMEWCPRCIKRLDTDIQEVIDFLSAEGYYCWEIKEDGSLKVIQLSELMHLEFGNIILYKSEKLRS